MVGGISRLLDLQAEPLLASSMDLASAGAIDGDDWVGFAEGRALVVDQDDPRGIAFDLHSGDSGPVELATPDGERFPTTGEMWAFQDGHAAASLDGEVALWKDGVLVDRVRLEDGPETFFEGSAQSGSRVLAGVRRGLVDGELRLILLDMSGDTIVQLADLGYPHIFTAAPGAEQGFYVVEPDGVLRTYDDDGALLDEDVLPFDLDRRFPWAFDGRGTVAKSLALPTPGRSHIEVVDLVSGDTTAFDVSMEVAMLGFARGDELLVAIGSDGAVRILDVATGVTSPILWTGSGVPFQVPWYDETSDSVWVASTDRLAQLPLGRDAWRERACQRVGRDLTEDEWERLVPGDSPRIPLCPDGQT